MVLTFLKNTMYMLTIPLIKLQNLRTKMRILYHCLKVFMHAFCHTRVENLLKGSDHLVTLKLTYIECQVSPQHSTLLLLQDCCIYSRK